jgi:hypothetical protein
MIHQPKPQHKSKKTINTLKLVSVFLLVGLGFVWLSWASDPWTQKMDDLAQVTHFIVSFLSRWRAIFATIAGKLMSNEIIYWSFMNLDVFLRKTRNVMKNFANYTLWFLFLYMIIQSIINKDSATDIIKKKIVWFVVAWVLIQASRFLFAAIIDIATISVTTISSIPAQILQSDIWLQRKVAQLNAEAWVSIPSTWAIKTWRQLTFDPNKKLETNQQYITIKEIPLQQEITQENYLDIILPNQSTISGPLIFFGTSIFKFQDYSITNPETKDSRKRLMEFWLNLIIILIYSIAMLGLIIINFFRIFFLWIAIIFSPFIVIVSTNVIDKSKIKFLEDISIAKIMTLIFKPVIFMAYISIMMIFVIWVKAILVPMTWWDVNLNDEVVIKSQANTDPSAIKTYDSSIQSNWIFEFSVNWAKNSLADLIVAAFTLFLMRFLLKAALTSGSGVKFIDDKVKSMTDSAQRIAWQMPIVPIAWWVGVNSVIWSGWLVSQISNSISSNMDKDNLEKMAKAFPQLDRSKKTNSKLEKAAKSSDPKDFWTESKSHAKSQWWISYERSTERQNAMQTRFDTNKKDEPNGRKRKNLDTLDKFIDDKGNLAKIHQDMWWKVWDQPISKETFISKTYWKK